MTEWKPGPGWISWMDQRPPAEAFIEIRCANGQPGSFVKVGKLPDWFNDWFNIFGLYWRRDAPPE
jgi:hypothetical protein